MKIGVISLGCDKNRVDTEKMLARLVGAGHSVVSNENDAEVLIVNTCGFIDSTKQESVDEILNAIAVKQTTNCFVIATGCLTQRYKDSLQSDLPEVDAMLGVADYDKIVDIVDNLEKRKFQKSFDRKDEFLEKRFLTTPYHYGYLKIADGCDNHCTYCAIPKIRGKYKSEKMEDLLKEAKGLIEQGVKELILVAQDVTRYGIDLCGKPQLIPLLDELSKLDFEWIRLLYLEPEMVDDELIDYIATNEKICKYMDIPFQHVDDEVLKRMNRHTTEKYTKQLVEKVKSRGIAIRTSFIVGFPGETKKQFEKLCDFVENYKIDYAGFFAYSREAGTPADKLEKHLSEKVKNKRVDKLKKLQEKIIIENNKKLIGKKIRVLYDNIDYDNQCFVGRAEFQTPDIDNITILNASNMLEIGEIYDVEITNTKGIDLEGKVYEELG